MPGRSNVDDVVPMHGLILRLVSEDSGVGVVNGVDVPPMIASRIIGIDRPYGPGVGVDVEPRNFIAAMAMMPINKINRTHVIIGVALPSFLSITRPVAYLLASAM